MTTQGTINRWYTTLEAVKAAVKIDGADLDATLGRYIAAASEKIEEELRRRFIPETATKRFPWPAARGSSYVLYFDNEEPLAVTQVLAGALDTSPVTITQYFLEPVNLGPPYRRLEINLGSQDAFQSNSGTWQRSLAVAGRWGARETTQAAGLLTSGVDDAVVTWLCSDGSLVGVGDTLLVDTEAAFVESRTWLDTTATLGADLGNGLNTVQLTASNGALLHEGESILIDAETMLIMAIAGNAVIVKRQTDANILQAHSMGASIFANRQLTVVRGVNGTTAAAHAGSAPLARYVPPMDISTLCLALAINYREQGRAGWSGVVGPSGDGAIELRGYGLTQQWSDAKREWGGGVARIGL